MLRRLRPVPLATAVAVLLLLAASRMIAVSAAATDDSPAYGTIWSSKAGCERVRLSTQPGWNVSGAWSPQGSTLLLVDFLYGKILAYQKDGRCLGTVSETVESSFDGLVPTRLAVRGDGFVLGLAGHRIVTLDGELTPTQRTDFRSEAVREGVQLDSMFMSQVTPTAALTFSDYQAPDGWKSSFFRVPLAAPASFQRLGDQPIGAAARVYYRLGSQYIASLGETGYFLEMEPEMRIVRNEPGSATLASLTAFPPEPRQLATPPDFYSLKNTEEVMGAVERTTMPVGIFGWKDYLYVVSHSPGAADGIWKISKIDPRQDRLVGWTSLPAQAAHVTVVPGVDQWTFLEKGHVRKFGDQPAETMLHVPASLLEGISAPSENVCD